MLPAQTTFEGPEMVVGMAVALVMVNVRAVEFPAQLPAVTDKVPVVNPARNPIVTEVVPCPLWMKAFAGTVQLYAVALATAATVKVLEDETQAPFAIPEMLTGVPGFAE